MKLKIGHLNTTYGTIEDTPDGLKYSGDEQKLRDLVTAVVSPEKPENAPGGLPGFMHWFARQVNNGYLWSETVTGE